MGRVLSAWEFWAVALGVYCLGVLVHTVWTHRNDGGRNAE